MEQCSSTTCWRRSSPALTTATARGPGEPTPLGGLPMARIARPAAALLSLASVFILLLQIVPTRASAFSFNWLGQPAAPQSWVPGSQNDWDLVSNIDAPTDQTGPMNAVHGPACEAPPATHPIVNLSDSA